MIVMGVLVLYHNDNGEGCGGRESLIMCVWLRSGVVWKIGKLWCGGGIIYPRY